MTTSPPLHLVLIKLPPEGLSRMIASKGACLTELSAGEIAGYLPDTDVEDRIPYRDIRMEAEDPSSAVRAIIDGGQPLPKDPRWGHTHPVGHAPARVQALARLLPAVAARRRLLDRLVHPDGPNDPSGPEAMARIARFFARASAEGKAVIAGVG